MDHSEQQIPFRSVYDDEHAKIKNLLLGSAKMLVYTMTFIIALSVIACFMIFMEMRKNGVPAVAGLIALGTIMAVYLFILKDMRKAVSNISEQQYVVAECIVTAKEKKSAARGGIHYSATVSYANGISLKVRVTTEKIFETAEIGKPALVIYFLDWNGNPKKREYTLVVI